MCPQNRLRAPQVRVARNDSVRIALSAIQQRPHQPREELQSPIDLTPQPQPNIERDLLIAAAPRVNFPGERPDLLAQLTNHQRVDVFVVSALVEPRLLSIRSQLIERRNQLLPLRS